jgi:2-polyprenyl-3-methyl-5-hydroxy-6-metoxy-1,4-benzoquinol methylase
MDHAVKKHTSVRRWLSVISDAESLEAPRREFIGHRDIITRNLSRYHFIAPHVSGSLLEIGCGRGYGLEVLAPRTSVQVGIDISANFLRDARDGNPSAAFACATGDALPLAAHYFDSVIAFDVIEHAQDDVFFLREIRRVARQGAFITLSTPNRLVASGNRITPLNRFHVREYLAAEFCDLVKPVFSSVEVFGQFDPQYGGVSGNSLLDKIPVRWKYLLPHNLQSLFSVAIRSPLRLEDCRFHNEDLDHAHTFVALCRV